MKRRELQVVSQPPSPKPRPPPRRDMQHFRHVRYGNLKRCLWLTLENPGYSIPSKLFSLLSIGVVLTSIAAMCIHSLPEYQVLRRAGNPNHGGSAVRG